MQRAGISFPIEFYGRAFEFGIDIIRLDSQRAVQNRFLLGETAQKTITKRSCFSVSMLRGSRSVARSRLRTASSCLPWRRSTKPSAENTVIIGQGLGGDFQLGQGRVIIEIASI